MSIIITLDYPITDGNGNQINEITIRRPKVKDIRKMNANAKLSDADKEMHLVHDLTGLLIEDIENLDVKDYGKINEALMEMMGKPTSQA